MEGMEKFEEYMQSYLHESRVRGAKFIRDSRWQLNRFKNYLDGFDLDPFALGLKEAQNYQLYLVSLTNIDGKIRYSKRSVDGLISAASKLFRYLKMKGAVITNPFVDVVRVKQAKPLPRHVLSEEEMDKFLLHLRGFTKGKTLQDRKNLYRMHVISELMYATGARLGEVQNLKITDIDFDRNLVRLKGGKSGETREAILNEYAAKVLNIYITKIRKYLVSQRVGRNLDHLFGVKSQLGLWLNKSLSRESRFIKLGKFTSHGFRHAVGTHLLRAGCDIRYIQDILGHKNLSTTQIYTRVEKSDLLSVLDKFHPRQWKGRESKGSRKI